MSTIQNFPQVLAIEIQNAAISNNLTFYGIQEISPSPTILNY